MDKDKIDIIPELFAKNYLTELSDDEKVQLEKWMNEDKKRNELASRIKGPGFVPEELKRLSQIDGRVGYECFQRRRRRIRILKYTKYAAVILPLGFFLSWGGYWLVNSESQPSEQVTIAMPIVPGSVKAELMMDDGTTYKLGDEIHKMELKEHNVKILVQAGKLCYDKTATAATVKYNTLVVPRGGEYVLVLSDNTVVHLNAASKLRYPVQFGEGKREVYLEGEAFFDVSKRKVGSEFQVHTRQGQISVLGTSFNVRAYEDEQIEATTLISGKVKVHTPEKELVIAPGEQCCADMSGGLTKREVDVYPFIAWKEGIFAFDKQPLEEVMVVIGRWYNIDAQFETEQVRKILISGKIKRFSDFRNVIQLLEMTGNLEFKVDGKQVTVSRK